MLSTKEEQELEKVIQFLLKQEVWMGLFLLKVCPLIGKMPNDIKREYEIRDLSENYSIPVSVIKGIIKFKR